MHAHRSTPARPDAAARPRLLSVALALVVPLAGCQGRHVFTTDGSTAGQPSSVSGSTPSGNGRVFLSDRDLAPVDAFISARNAQWILGDEVEVTASREYFAQVLTVNATVGEVSRQDTTRADETTVDLVSLRPGGAVVVTSSPRILIGTGLTVTARKRLTLHLVKTRDQTAPVRLRVHAQGNASRGRHDDVLDRQPVLDLGGEIRLDNGRWTWFPIG